MRKYCRQVNIGVRRLQRDGLAACTSDGYCMEVSENLGIYGTCDTSKSCGTVRDVAKWTTAFDLAVEIYAEFAVASLSNVITTSSIPPSAIDASGSTYSTPFYATVALRPFKPSATLKPYWWSSSCNELAECTADATVIALITAEMNTFNAVDSKIQIVADWYEGIYVRYADATTKDSTRVLQTLRNIHAALGEWELCGHTTKHPVYNCQRDLRWDTFTLVSLAYANAALFLGAFIFFVPEAIRIGKKWAPCCGDGSQVVRAVVSASGSGSFDDSARAI